MQQATLSTLYTPDPYPNPPAPKPNPTPEAEAEAKAFPSPGELGRAPLTVTRPVTYGCRRARTRSTYGCTPHYIRLQASSDAALLQLDALHFARYTSAHGGLLGGQLR